MKIEDSGRSPEPASPAARPAPHGKNYAPADPAGPPPADTAPLSGIAANLSPSNEARVAELKRLYEAGQYSVPAADVAASLIREHEQS